MASEQVMNEVFGKIHECWDCGKCFRAKKLYRLRPNADPVPLCNSCFLIRKGVKIDRIRGVSR